MTGIAPAYPQSRPAPAIDLLRRSARAHPTAVLAARGWRVCMIDGTRTHARETAPEALAPNDIGRVALTLAHPIAADRYGDNRATGSFILIDEATHATIAAGMIR